MGTNGEYSWALLGLSGAPPGTGMETKTIMDLVLWFFS